MLQPTSSYRREYIDFITVCERDGESFGVPSYVLPIHEDVDIDSNSSRFIAHAISKPWKFSLGRVEEGSEILRVNSEFWLCVQMPHKHLSHKDSYGHDYACEGS